MISQPAFPHTFKLRDDLIPFEAFQNQSKFCPPSRLQIIAYLRAMQITDELLDRIEALSMLSFKPEEREKTKEGFQRMLDFVAKLQELDTTGVEPLIHMTNEVNRLIPDEATEPLPQKLVLKNAPASDDAHFHVPKVLKK